MGVIEEIGLKTSIRSGQYFGSVVEAEFVALEAFEAISHPKILFEMVFIFHLI